MSEFKSGDKVLAEVCIIGVARVQGEERYIVTDDDKYASETLAIKMDRVHPLPTKTYEDGLREAWGLARRIVFGERYKFLSRADMQKFFGVERAADVFAKFTPQKAADCIAMWEAKTKIQVRDQVRLNGTDEIGVVMKVTGPDESKEYLVWWSNGSSGFEPESKLAKTGRTIDIAGLLRQIAGDFGD